MKSKVVPLRIPENLDALADLSAQEEHTDKATALRQWLHRGAALYVVKLVAEGRISIGRAAELLDVTVYDLTAPRRNPGHRAGGYRLPGWIAPHLTWAGLPP